MTICLFDRLHQHITPCHNPNCDIDSFSAEGSRRFGSVSSEVVDEIADVIGELDEAVTELGSAQNLSFSSCATDGDTTSEGRHDVSNSSIETQCDHSHFADQCARTLRQLQARLLQIQELILGDASPSSCQDETMSADEEVNVKH